MANVILVLSSPDLLLWRFYQCDRIVMDLVADLIASYRLAHNTVPTFCCYGCHAQITPESYFSITGVTAAKGSNVFTVIVCAGVETCKNAATIRLRAWINGYKWLANHAGHKIRLRSCGWCPGAQLMTDSPATDGRRTEMLCCARCKDRYYCDETCRAKAWPVHRLLCTLVE